jgi:hypothetical protein
MGVCSGNEDDHCCYLDGNVCVYLEENTVQGRRWACGIRKKYSSWEETYKDSEYIQFILPILSKIGISNCGDWPRKGEICIICNVRG